MKEELNSEQLHMKAHFSFISLITQVSFRPNGHAQLFMLELHIFCFFSGVVVSLSHGFIPYLIKILAFCNPS